MLPPAARLGDTVGIAVGSSHNPLATLDGTLEHDGLSSDNVLIDLVDPGTGQSHLASPIAPRIVFDGLSASPSATTTPAAASA